jgi:hypothetical protein
LNGTEVAALLEGLCVWLRGRGELEPQTLCPVPGVRLVIGDEPTPAVGRGSRGGKTNAEKCAARRARNAARPHLDPTATPPPTPHPGSPPDPEPTPLAGVATPLPTPLDPTSPGVASPSALPLSGSDGCNSSGENNHNNRSGARAEPTPPTPLPTPHAVSHPRSLEDALSLPLLERAQLCAKADSSGDSFRAQAMCPHQWPELQKLAARFREITGLEHVQAGPWPNANTKRLVELLAVPQLPSVIERAFAALEGSSWWEQPEKRRLGLAGISPRVLEGLLTERGQPRPGAASRDLVRRVRGSSGQASTPEPLGASVERLVAAGGVK